jgi:hypothetical protein
VHANIQCEDLREMDHKLDLGVDGMIILQCIYMYSYVEEDEMGVACSTNG